MATFWQNHHPHAASTENTDFYLAGVLATGLLALVVILSGFKNTYQNPLQKQLRQLLLDLRSLRQGDLDSLSEDDCLVEIKQISREINRLHDALNQACQDSHRKDKKLVQQTDDQHRQFRSTVRQLEKTAQTDSLTGLANRKTFDTALQKMFAQAADSHSDLACLMIDLDNFKHVNDNFGHAAGDDVITFVAEILRASVRHIDIAARYGGDEFCLLLQDCSEKTAQQIAERIRMIFSREVCRLIPDMPDKTKVYLSVGIATLLKNRPCCPQQLLDLADQALYRVKQNGRNAVAIC